MSFVAERDSQNGLAHRSRTSSFWSDYANDTAKPQNATNGLRPEIPDSQPNTFEYRGNSSKTPDNPASFKTVATDIIPGGTKLTPRGEARWVSSLLMSQIHLFPVSLILRMTLSNAILFLASIRSSLSTVLVPL